MRSRMVPMCWSCGAWKVTYTSSAPRLRIIPFLFTLAPMKCTGCFRRFYTVEGVKPAAQRPAWQVQNRSLRYVNKKSNLPQAVHSLFGTPNEDVAVNIRVRVPAGQSAASETATAVATLPEPQHTEQLTNLLGALVSENGTTGRQRLRKKRKIRETIHS